MDLLKNSAESLEMFLTLSFKCWMPLFVVGSAFKNVVEEHYYLNLCSDRHVLSDCFQHSLQR